MTTGEVENFSKDKQMSTSNEKKFKASSSLQQNRIKECAEMDNLNNSRFSVKQVFDKTSALYTS